jgi:hypothetical protein
MGIQKKSLTLLLILTAVSANALNIFDASTIFNLHGTQVWSRTFGGTGGEWAFSVVQTSDGGYALAGYTTSYGAGKSDFWLIKTDSLGNQQWNKTYGGTANDWASSVVQTSDGGYALVGSTYSSSGSSYDFWLIKTDPSGNELWNKTYGTHYNDYASSVVETVDHGYALTGVTNSFGDGALTSFRDLFIVGNADAWLVKTDSSGNELWNKTFGGPHDDGAFSLAQTIDGGYALAGNTYSFSDGDNTDFWLVKTDSSGNELWNKTFGGPKDDFGYCVIQTNDGGCALVGITNSSGAGYEDVWLIKTDSCGNKLWDKTYGGSLNDEAYFVMQTEDDGYALAGSTYAFGAGLWDAWLIKTRFFWQHFVESNVRRNR